MDTGNDYRILVVEDAINRVAEMFRLKRFKFQFKHYRDCHELLEHAKRILQTVKYCYLEPDAIVQMPEFKEFYELTQKIENYISEEMKAASYKPDNPKVS